MATATEEGWDDIGGRLAGRTRGAGRLPRDPRGRGRRRHVRRRAAVRRGRRPGPPLDRPGRARAATSSPTSSPDAPDGSLATELARARRRRPRAAYAEFGRLARDRARAARRADEDAVGRERYALASRYFLGADGRPRGDLRLGLGGAQAASTTTWTQSPTGSSRAAASTTRSRRSTPTRAPAAAAREAFRDWMQAAGRPRPSPTWPACTSTSPSRSAGSSA